MQWKTTQLLYWFGSREEITCTGHPQGVSTSASDKNHTMVDAESTASRKDVFRHA